jgi:hypothetical protein
MIEIIMTKMPYGYNFFSKEKHIDIFCYGLNKKNAIKEFREEAKLKHKRITFIYVNR